MIMYGNYDKDFIMKYLISISELKSFYVYFSSDNSSGLIHYFDENNESWVLMEDDDELVESCILFLRERKIPLFDNLIEMKEHEDSIKK